MSGLVHIVGAGLAGLATAVRLSAAGRRVVLYEAAPQAGGRCRSFHDKQLDCLIDNGNHLLLSGNHAARGYLKEIGSVDAFEELAPAALPFLDLQTGERWRLAPGCTPLWLLDAKRRVPGTGLRDYLVPALPFAGDRTVADIIKSRGTAWRRFWHPLTVAALNTQPEEAAARLLWAVMRETFLKGEAACRPLIARVGLGPALIDPALRFLAARGGELRLGWRLRSLTRQNQRVTRLDFDSGSQELAHEDELVLALPPWNLSELLPELPLPFAPRAIVNAHLKLPKAPAQPLLGLIGGTAEWLFVRGAVVSLTVSAAEAQLEQPRPDLTQRLWADTAKALGLQAEPQPPLRLLIEKRATFAATPEAEKHRPRAAALGGNVTLAGDWTATGLPATIEGAIRSGFAAAQSVLSER